MKIRLDVTLQQSY